ncbi:hypothetical protein RE428_05750 [Marinobacter nanhaiticus D15-8W]|uniref:DUF2235 domain-containing protein n=1 Tax=Marinobacter nanhaiticus D15-8W TaxID=626887 RepID=N6VX00_9GAMM|nr:DUF2235 domain-containing protein [Marinobacter nanhaiticus]ENO14755.1 DUF2235 domain-containing protein [Marinobacter nanhaiticus D15-8W]BES69557.1 hypothetical protein RE428_05750 [Marinobacter nanhaiticus D15-8W]
MQIKKPRDLTLRDLPNIESPFVAASKIEFLANRPGSSLTWDQSLVEDSPFEQPLDQQTFVDRLQEKLEKGELLMVYGVTDGHPFSPLVAWHEGGALPARWQLEKSVFGLNLEHKIAQLNDWQITPEQIDHLGPGGVGHLSASSFDSDLRAQKAEERAQAKQNQERSLSGPIVAAAAVAPLGVAAQESDEEAEPEKKLHFEVGIFTDGTLNDATNVENFLEELNRKCASPNSLDPAEVQECKHRLALVMGASYSNGKTNVAKLFDLYRQQQTTSQNEIVHTIRIYKNGVGTTTGGEDSLWSSATGLGSSGISEQVKSAFEDTAAAISRASGKKAIGGLTIDLFGFSRGAAASRHAAHEISKGKNGLLAEIFGRYHLKWPEKVSIRFVGLFDTVAGVVNVLRTDLSASNDKTTPINLFLDPNSVETAVHLTAADECRENFALNSISNPDGSLPEHFREISLPGVHSDVGGGYHDEQDEHVLLSRKRVISDSRTEWPKQTMDWDNLESILDATRQQGWIGNSSIRDKSANVPALEIHQLSRVHPTPHGRVDLTLEMKRRVFGQYAGVGLRLMHQLALDAGVKLDEIDEKDPTLRLPDELRPIHKTISEQIEAGANTPSLTVDELELLKQRYVHHSDNFNTVEFMLGNKIAELEVPWDLLLPFMPTHDRARIIHPNEPEHS